MVCDSVVKHGLDLVAWSWMLVILMSSRGFWPLRAFPTCFTCSACTAFGAPRRRSYLVPTVVVYGRRSLAGAKHHTGLE